MKHASEPSSSGNVIEPVRTITNHDCIAVYRSCPSSLHPFDVQRLDESDAAIGCTNTSRTREAWGVWHRGRGHHLAPSTVARWRSILLVALTYGADEFGIAAPSLPILERLPDRAPADG